ncbi:MAG: hypothetical protein QM831_22760 [Kofleriaceae bacterium]
MRWAVMFMIACGSNSPSTPTIDAPNRVVDAPAPDAGLAITEGILDPTFGTNGVVTLDLGGSELAGRVTREPSGRIVISGGMLFGFTSDGRLDTSFGNDGEVAVTSSFADLVAANDDLYLLSSTLGAERHLATGEVDTTYGDQGKSTLINGTIGVEQIPGGATVDTEGRVISTFLDATSHVRVIRFLANGIEDSQFTRVDLGPGYQALPVAVQSDKKILVGRSPNGESTAIVRLADNGTVDPSYNPPVATAANVPTRGLVTTADDHAWLAGFVLSGGYYFDHLTSAGAETPGFPISFTVGDIVKIVALPDGGVIGVGVAPGPVGFAIAVSADGLRATRWTIGGSLFGVCVGTDGSVYVAGGSAPPGDPSDDLLVAKLSL